MPVKVPDCAGKAIDAALPDVSTGVIVTVAVTGVVVGFVAVKAAILPVPFATRPMDGVLLVQLNVVPPTGPVKFTGAVNVPLHTVWFATGSTTGVGATVIVKISGVPVQVTPLVYAGVTVIVAVTGVVPVLVAVNDGRLPVPLAARPIDGVLFVQL